MWKVVLFTTERGSKIDGDSDSDASIERKRKLADDEVELITAYDHGGDNGIQTEYTTGAEYKEIMGDSDILTCWHNNAWIKLWGKRVIATTSFSNPDYDAVLLALTINPLFNRAVIRLAATDERKLLEKEIKKELREQKKAKK